MGLTYDGITYRSLEEQVRYDAEQVQLLKQADATINESLQTINTEINGKLTKPTNPSAESAVTMLADGTVGTKPLSEIGGGKLYLHSLTLANFVDSSSSPTETANNTMVRIYSSKSTPFDMSSTAALQNEIFHGTPAYEPFPATYYHQYLEAGVSNKSATFVLHNGVVAFIFVDNKRYENQGNLGVDTVTEL